MLVVGSTYAGVAEDRLEDEESVFADDVRVEEVRDGADVLLGVSLEVAEVEESDESEDESDVAEGEFELAVVESSVAAGSELDCVAVGVSVWSGVEVDEAPESPVSVGSVGSVGKTAVGLKRGNRSCPCKTLLGGGSYA